MTKGRQVACIGLFNCLFLAFGAAASTAQPLYPCIGPTPNPHPGTPLTFNQIAQYALGAIGNYPVAVRVDYMVTAVAIAYLESNGGYALVTYNDYTSKYGDPPGYCTRDFGLWQINSARPPDEACGLGGPSDLDASVNAQHFWCQATQGGSQPPNFNPWFSYLHRNNNPTQWHNAVLNATAAVIDHLDVTPSAVTIDLSSGVTTSQLTATAVLQNNTAITQDRFGLLDGFGWLTSDSTVADVTSTGLVLAQAASSSPVTIAAAVAGLPQDPTYGSSEVTVIDDSCSQSNTILADGQARPTATCPNPPGGNPPPGSNPPPPQPGGTWVWDPTANGGQGGWVFVPTAPPISVFNGAVVGPIDPNDKAGSLGAGSAQFLSGRTPLRYVVQFANETTASAPAQKVVVTDQIQLAVEDPASVNFGPIAFGTQLVSPPVAGGVLTLDLRPTTNLLVAIESDFNNSTGLLTWIFQSLDPSTNKPPLDPLAGFLPPGIGGSVFFTVMPQRGLATGVQVQNQATIVFDANAPMTTSTWLNTLDNTLPTSHVLPLPATETSNSFTVNWSGTDVGAGVQDFTVDVSDNGGPFTPFQMNTTATSTTFAGQTGHTYGFYSIARDLVGNVEAPKTAADTSTIVSVPSGPVQIPSTDVSVTATGLAYSRVSQTFNGSVTITNIESAAVAGPLQLMLTALPAGVTVVNATGTSNGSPFIMIPGVTSLAPGQSVTVSVQFKNSRSTPITFTPVVYSGQLP